MDFYEILDVPKGATPEEINAAYRNKAREFHPDTNHDDPKAADKFKQVAQAYEVLGNEEKRAVYDHRGHASRGFFDPFSVFGGDFFRKNRGNDVHTDVTVTLEDVFHGCTKSVSFRKMQACVECGGKGFADLVPCEVCKGSGQQEYHNAPFKFFARCSFCNGMGKIPKNKCVECNGSGRCGSEVTSLDVKIPPGIENNQLMALSGEGQPGPSQNGDLFIHVRVKPHNEFTRSGLNLHCEKEVKYTDLIFGTHMEVTTINGQKTKFWIPPRTGIMNKFKLNGLGLKGKKGRGDLFVSLNLLIPDKLTEEHESLLKKLALL